MERIEVPLSLVFSEGSEPEVLAKAGSVTDQWRKHHQLFANRPVACLPHVGLFESFIHDQPKRADAYRNWWRTIHETRGLPSPAIDPVVEKYKALWRAESRGDSLPTPVAYRFSDDHFNLSDGHHRAALWCAMGKQLVHLLVPRHVVEAWRARNSPAASSAIDTHLNARRKAGLPRTYTPIDVPEFFGLHAERPGTVRLDAIRQFLARAAFRPQTVLDVGANIGYYSHHFARDGARCAALEPDALHRELAEVLSDTYGLRHLVALVPSGAEEYVSEKPHDIVLAFSIFYHLLFRLKTLTPEGLGRFLDLNVGTYLFWESGWRPEEEIAIITTCSGLRHYAKLKDTAGTGLERQVGVFAREPLSEGLFDD